MNFKAYTSIFIFSVFSLFLVLCTGKIGFYKHAYDGDIARLPLIEPHELRSYDGGADWVYKVVDSVYANRYTFQLAGIDKVANNGRIIVLYLSETHIPSISNNYTPLWYMIDTEFKKDTAFTSEVGLRQTLAVLGMDSIKFHEVNKVFMQFKNESKLPDDWVNK